MLICDVQEDSVFLWKSIVSNKILAHVDLILFLNKCDILSTYFLSSLLTYLTGALCLNRSETPFGYQVG